LPVEHSKEDMLKIARAHFPGGDLRCLKLLAAYALGTEKKQASGIVEALESARYRAELAGRDEPSFADIEEALTHDHGFLLPAPPNAYRSAGKTAAEPLQSGSNRVARTISSPSFSTRVPHAGARATTPVAT